MVKAEQPVYILGLAELNSSETYANPHTGTQKVRDELTPSAAAALVARRAIESAQINISQIDFVISATQTPDFNNPGLVSRLLAELQLGVGGLEIKQGVHGALHALILGKSLIRTGTAKNILIVAVDFLSRYFNSEVVPQGLASEAFKTFGDGAAACVLSAQSQTVCPILEIYQHISATSSAHWQDLVSPLPSSNQFPLRLTQQDVAEGRHFPTLNTAELIAHSQDLKPIADFVSTLPGVFPLWCTHEICAGQLQSLRTLAQTSGASVLETGLKIGYLGSAGVLCAMQQGLKQSGNLLALTIGAGPSWSALALKRVE